jgi:hypothetical protein
MPRTFPPGEEEFFLKQKELITVLTPYFAGWGIDMGWVNDKLTPARIKYEQLHALCENPLTRTKANLILRDAAEKEYRNLLAMLVAMVKAVPGLTEDLLESYGIAAAKSGPHNDKTPDGVPDLTFILTKLREITVVFGTRPDGVHETEIMIKVGGEKPTSLDEFQHSDAFTTSPHTYKFDENQRFTVVYFIARYRSETGKVGAWSAIYSVAIP